MEYILHYILVQLLITLAIAFSSTTNETDHQALLHIKGQLSGDPFDVLSSWNDSIPFCNWKGVICGKRHQRVTVLNMSSLNLVATLSPFIGNLTFLQEINIEDNNFHGLVPDEIGRLFRLQFLRFANNSFEGKIPVNLTRCSELQIIDLGGNKLKGGIPQELSSLSKLYALTLSRNNLSGNIPPALGNVSSLQILSISRNNLTGNIPAEIGKLLNLQTLELSSNKLSGAVPSQLYNISALQKISITNNQFIGNFPSDLVLKLPNLTSFLADINHFFGSIPPTLANASGLIKISIGDNALTGPIPQNLGSLHTLQVLHFGHNPLGTDRTNDISFISTLSNCTNLRVLSLSNIEIGGVLPNSIGNLSTKLTSFWINDNYISGDLPPGVGNLFSLGYFDVRNNALSNTIPDSMGKLTNLKELYLSENIFTGDIPASIGNISGMQILVLELNKLTGPIPVSLSNCTGLQGLTISNNLLTGPLPRDIFSLSSLSLGLLFAKNQLTGPLPSEIGNLKNLASLDFSRNKLTGEIPITIDGCEMLEILRLRGNFLDGTIPSSLGNLKNIEVMDLSQNNLSGQIPATLGKLNFITTLNLSFNMLEGEVPMDGVFGNSTYFSVAGNERICGGIKAINLPPCPKARKRQQKLSTSVIIALAIGIPLVIVSLVACLYVLHRKRSSRQPPTATSTGEKQNVKISYAELFESTDGFSSENLIGDGKYGSVYKGILKPGDRIFAVKVLKLHQPGAYKSFMAECEALRNIRHRNLVKIITACSSIDFKGNDFKALVFEYVPNGSLENWLHPNSHDNHEPKKLNLLQRLSIAIDIASALDYLHHDCENPIVHCDLKPSNILLGDDIHAQVSDFGLAKFLPMEEGKSGHRHNSSIGIRGTVGYVAPEYGMGGEVSTSGDIYSYGILLLEMFTGKRPTHSMFSEDVSLHMHVKKALPHEVLEIVDPQISQEEENGFNNITKTSKDNIVRIEECCLSIFQIGLSCSAEMHKERRDIKDVLTQLHAIRNQLIQHKF